MAKAESEPKASVTAFPPDAPERRRKGSSEWGRAGDVDGEQFLELGVERHDRQRRADHLQRREGVADIGARHLLVAVSLSAERKPNSHHRVFRIFSLQRGPESRAHSQAIEKFGAPNRTRTGVFAVRGRRPGPLDDGSSVACGQGRSLYRRRRPKARRATATNAPSPKGFRAG